MYNKNLLYDIYTSGDLRANVSVANCSSRSFPGMYHESVRKRFHSE